MLENVSTLMERLLLSYQRITKEALKSKLPGMSHVQFKLLFETKEHEGVSMQEMASRMNADLTTFSRQIQSLQKAGYLYKTSNKDDRRIFQLYLTEEGKEAVESVIVTIQQQLELMLTNISTFEEEVILRSLTVLSQKLGNGLP